MRIITETATTDLSGSELFPNLHPEVPGFDTIRDSDSYLLSSLTEGAMTAAFMQVSSGGFRDVDTFTMQLDAGDTYQITFSTHDISSFMSNRGMTVFGADGDYKGLILNNYGNMFSANRTLTTATFTASQSGSYLLFAQLYHQGAITASYGLTLQKVTDVTPWDLQLTRNGMGATAVVTAGDQVVVAGTQITISLTFATANVTLDDIRMLVPGSMSRYISSTDTSTYVAITMSSSQSVRLRDLIELNFSGTTRAGSVEVESAYLSVGGSNVIIDVDPAVLTPGNKVINGTSGHDSLVGDVGDDKLSGLIGDDTLNGGAGNDTLIGGAGIDRLVGGAGNDTYNVDNVRDIVVELANQGVDQVQSTVSYTLGANVENLVLFGSGALTGIGNAQANAITGNVGNNFLSGLGGNDTLNGGAGNDTLSGGDGNDLLIGGAGVDRMSGGIGNDNYVVENASDVVTEMAGQGTDLVQSSVNYTLSANVENLTLTGAAALVGTGNILTNVINGNAGANRLSGLAGNDTIYGGGGNDQLDGGAGIDRMVGGAGNDTYVVDHAGDILVELANQGTDLVLSSVSYTLNGNVENLNLIGSANTNGAGNTLSNMLNGNSGNNRLLGLAGADTLNGAIGNDTLDGGAGNDLILGGLGNDQLIGGAGSDRLTGGAGADRFVFLALSESTTALVGRDTITDFNRAQLDRIDLSALDANARLAGNQSFSYRGDADFGGNAGELNARLVTGGTQISGDVNGDRIADFAILLDDRIVLGADSFIL